MYIFFVRHNTTLLGSGINKLDNTFALSLGPFLNSKVTKKNYKNVKNISLNRPKRRTLLYSRELNQRGAELHVSWECPQWTTQAFPPLHFSGKDPKSTTVLTLESQINFSK